MAAVSLPAPGRDADMMLLALMHGPHGVPVRIFRSEGQQWWIGGDAAVFLGSPLHADAHPAVGALSRALRDVAAHLRGRA